MGLEADPAGHRARGRARLRSRTHLAVVAVETAGAVREAGRTRARRRAAPRACVRAALLTVLGGRADFGARRARGARGAAFTAEVDRCAGATNSRRVAASARAVARAAVARTPARSARANADPLCVARRSAANADDAFHAAMAAVDVRCPGLTAVAAATASAVARAAWAEACTTPGEHHRAQQQQLSHVVLPGP